VSEALLELRGVEVHAGSRRILEVPRLAIHAASTTAVLGANGAGKSTLLRTAGALLTPRVGSVLLDGVPAAEGDVRRATAAVLQRPLLRRGSVRANAETGLRFRGVPRAVARARAEAWLARLGIAHLAERQAHTLSGGEAQRVSLARAFAVSPRLLLLDEPFAGLDAPTRGELLADVRELLAETSTAALLVTHDRHEAAALADRVAILHAGALRQHGPALEVLNAPRDAQCARLLGFETILPSPLAERLLGRGTGDVALRPEDCGVQEPGTAVDDPGAVRVAGALRRTVPFGAVSRVTVVVDGVALLATAPSPAPAWLADRKPGDRVVLRFAGERVRALKAA
jgi:ABC-type nitrate/sulfonate/bicarbonate transport system ATPase subunit